MMPMLRFRLSAAHMIRGTVAGPAAGEESEKTRQNRVGGDTGKEILEGCASLVR